MNRPIRLLAPAIFFLLPSFVWCLVRSFSFAAAWLLLGAAPGTCQQLAQTASPGYAQTANAVALLGVVSDPSGALVPNAAVHIAASDGSFARDLLTDEHGRFSLPLSPGVYRIGIAASGFDPFAEEVRIGATPITLQAHLLISTARTVVDITDSNNQMDTAGDANKDALDLKGSALATLSDDDSTFQQQLLALAGDDGSHPSQIFVDGFSGGTFPPKSSIREVRINHNPFSAAYESMGLGRIEILTKPGTGSLHGAAEIHGDPSAFNSRNPFLQQAEPPYYRVHSLGNIGGPLGRGTSFFVSGDVYDQQNNAVINAQTVDSSGAVEGISEAVPDPTTTVQTSARLDRQWSTNNTFTGRYEFDRVAQTNGGLSDFVLPSEAWNSLATTHTLQLRNTQILGANAEIDSRFAWIRTHSSQDPVSTAPTIMVEGTVGGGGSPSQMFQDHLDQLEFQEDGTLQHGQHLLRAGARYRLYREANHSTAGFNGTFTFPSLASYQATVQGTPSATQFQITAGRSNFAVLTGDLALWVEDEWKPRSNITADLGLRFESQSAIPDHADPSPHVAFAWALRQTGKQPPAVVLRLGSGIFYDRFPVANLLTAVRQGDPTLQGTYTVQNPQFFLGDIPPPSQLGSAVPPTTYRVAPDFRSEYEIDSSASAEFSLGKRGSISATYMYETGKHQWVSINANAPRADGTRPFGAAAGDRYEFFSHAEFRGFWLFTDPRINLTKNISLWGHFMMKRQSADSLGATSFASNSYDLRQDFGRSPWDRHQAAYFGMNAQLPWGLRSGLFLTTRGGERFNITTGADNNGDTLYNDRPSFATPGSNPAHVVHTAYGDLNLDPQPGETIIPINFGHSAGPFVSLQLQGSRTWRFGPRLALDASSGAPGKQAPRGDPRFALVFSVEAQNVTNSVSPAQPIGVLTSPFFGRPIATSNNFLSTTAANRTVTLHTGFQF